MQETRGNLDGEGRDNDTNKHAKNMYYLKNSVHMGHPEFTKKTTNLVQYVIGRTEWNKLQLQKRKTTSFATIQIELCTVSYLSIALL